MSRTFIIDEWLWSDLYGENGKEKQKEAIDFLEKLCKKCDKIVTVKESKFKKKALRFLKNAAEDIVRRKVAKLYASKILYNSVKYEEIDIENGFEIDLTDKISPDDVYLVKAYQKTKGLLITTDSKLKTTLEQCKILCKLRDDFLKDYCKDFPSQ